MEMYVGMDVHSKDCVYAIEDKEGRLLGEGRVETTYEGLEAFRDRHGVGAGTSVAIESGNMAFLVARWLVRLDLVPVVVDAREVRMLAHRPTQKTDRRDAIELCEGLRRGFYRAIVHVPPREIQELRRLLSRRRYFVESKTAEVNAARHVVRTEGLGHLVGKLNAESGWTELLRRLDFAPDLAGLVECHRAAWQAAHDEQKWLEGEIDRLQEKYFAEPVRRLQQILGVGPIVSLTVVAALSDVHRFKSAKQVASYAGIVPSSYQSGEKDYQGRITKKGSPELRAMLCEAAHQAASPKHPFHPFFAKICGQHGYKRAVTAVSHRLLRVMWAMLRTGEDFDFKRLGIEEGDFTQIKRKKYRLAPRGRAARAAPIAATGL